MFRFGRKKAGEPQDSYTGPSDENKRGNGRKILGGRGSKESTTVVEPKSADDKSSSLRSRKGRTSKNEKHDDSSYASSLTSQSRTRQQDSLQGTQRIEEEDESGAGLSAEEKFMSYFQQKRASESITQPKVAVSEPKVEAAALYPYQSDDDDDDVYNSGDHLAMMAAATKKEEEQKRRQKEQEEASMLKQQEEEAARTRLEAQVPGPQKEEQDGVDAVAAVADSSGHTTEEQRRAKARQAVEDRKRKAREAVEARKAKARQASQGKSTDSELEEGRNTEERREVEEATKQAEEARSEKQRLMEEADAARKAQEEKERLEKEKAEEARQEKLRQEEEDTQRQLEELRQEELRLEEQMREAEAKARIEEEFKKLEEEERKLNEEMARLEEDAKRVLEESRKMEEEAKKMKEIQLAEEAKRSAEEKERAAKIEEERTLVEERERAEKIALEIAANEARLEEERLQAEAREKAEKIALEEARAEEEKRPAEEREQENERAIEIAVEEARLEQEKRQVEEARLAAEQLAFEQARQAEEARLAVERFADEQKAALTSEAQEVSDEEIVDTEEDLDGAPDIESSENDLSALLDDDDDALLDSVLDCSPQPVGPTKGKSILRNSISKLLSGGKNKGSEKKKKESTGLLFNKAKSENAQKNAHQIVAPTPSIIASKVPMPPPRPMPVPVTQRTTAPQKALPPPARNETPTVVKDTITTPASSETFKIVKDVIKIPARQETSKVVKDIIKTPPRHDISNVVQDVIKTPDRPDQKSFAIGADAPVVSHVPTAHRGTGTSARGLPIRKGRKSPTKSPRFFPQSPARSVDSTGSVASIDRIPRSPYMKADGDSEPACSNPYNPTLHVVKEACQICVFRLSDYDRERFEKNGRSLLVNTTAGGCIDCKAFPSHDGEDPVRICRQCFFNTHLQCKRVEEAFAGPGALAGASHCPRFVHGRPSL